MSKSHTRYKPVVWYLFFCMIACIDCMLMDFWVCKSSPYKHNCITVPNHASILHEWGQVWRDNGGATLRKEDPPSFCDNIWEIHNIFVFSMSTWQTSSSPVGSFALMNLLTSGSSARCAQTEFSAWNKYYTVCWGLTRIFFAVKMAEEKTNHLSYHLLSLR